MAGEGKRRLERAVDGMISGKQDKVDYIPALLGVYIDGQKTIVVAGRPDFVWCRVRGSISDIVMAFNEEVSETWDLPILIFRDPNAPDLYKVHGRDIRTYPDWGGDFYSSRPHGRSHSFGRPEGSDPVWVYKRQQMALLPRPLISGTLGIYIEPEFYYFDGTYRWWPGSGTTSLAGYKPTGSYNGRFVTVYIDGNTGNPNYLSGPEFNAYVPPLDPIAYVSLPTPDQGIPIAAVFLITGTERIGWGEIYDLRLMVAPVPGTGSNLHVYDEGISLGMVGSMNFVGDNVEAIVSGSFAWVSVTGSAQAMPVTGSVTVYDEGVLLGQADAINVVGTEAEIVLSGTTAHIMHTGTLPAMPVSGSVTILDEGVLQGQADTLDFIGAGVVAAMAGDTAEITIPGGGGAATTGSVGDWSIYYEFHTGTPVSPGQIAFSGLTGSMVTGILCDEWDVDSASSLMRLDRMRMNGLYIAIWSTANPLKWWMGQIERDTGGDQIGDIVLSVGYQGHSGGDTPFDEGERVVLTAGFRELAIYDDGVFQANASALDFGDNLDVSISGGSYVTIAGGGGLPPTTGSVVIFDEGSLLGSVLGMNFTGDNVEAVISGSYAHIMHTGTAGGGGAALAVVTGTHYVEEVLYEVTLGSATGSIVIPAISQDYDHLRMIINARTDRAAAAADNLNAYFNGDLTDANYRNAVDYGGTTEGGGAADEPSIGIATAVNAGANSFAPTKALIEDYALTTKNKTVLSESGERQNATIYARQFMMSWENTAAINRIDLAPSLGTNLVSGTHAQLIGIREQVVVTSVEGTTEPSIADLAVTTGTFDVGVVLLDETLVQGQDSFYVSGSFSDYEYIEILLSGRKTTAGSGLNLISFNGDTTNANYRRTYHNAESADHGTGEADDRWFGTVVGSDITAGYVGATRATIFDPGNTSFHKAIRSLVQHRTDATTLFVTDIGVQWEDTSAITEIQIDISADNYAAGTRAKIIGYKAQVVVTDVSGGVLVDGVTDFLALDDTPASYSGQSGSYARVDGDEDALEFVTPTFLNLDDTPASYNLSGAFPQVNAAQDGLEWVAAEPWNEVLGGVGFENSWVNYGGVFSTAAYFKDPFGVVHLKGLVKDGTIGNFAIFTLPSGYRPAREEIFMAISNSAVSEFYVTAAGTVKAQTGNNAWVAMNGITFRADGS